VWKKHEKKKTSGPNDASGVVWARFGQCACLGWHFDVLDGLTMGFEDEELTAYVINKVT
jgi:hypothetical protein